MYQATSHRLTGNDEVFKRTSLFGFFPPPHLRTSAFATYIINMWGNLAQIFLITLPHLPQNQSEKLEMLAMLSDKKVHTFRQGRKGLNHYL